MIIVTGGQGFIGKALINELVRRGYSDVISLDTKTYSLDYIYDYISNHQENIKGIFHMGAIVDTMLTNKNMFYLYNFSSSVEIWNLCSAHKIPLIYASTGATYGDGKNGFDDEQDISNLMPLNRYGWSKQHFDLYIKSSVKKNIYPPYWYGLKFFNVYGYDESHKDNMASVAFQMYNQIKKNGHVKLFKSHNPEYKDGEQLRDFIYIDDIVDVCIWMFEHKPESEIYNIGTGKARTFNDLAKAVFDQNPINIDYIDIPIEIRNNYQYFTEAKINKLRKVGYLKPFTELEDGIKKYINKLQS